MRIELLSQDSLGTPELNLFGVKKLFDCSRSAAVSAKERVLANAYEAGNFGNRAFSSSEKKFNIIRKIICLFSLCSPPAIFGGIVSRVVNAVNTVLQRRAQTHVRDEILKSVPSRAYRNPTPSVAVEVSVFAVVTALVHSMPNVVSRCCGQTVLPLILPLEASARFNSPSFNMSYQTYFNGAALAQIARGCAISFRRKYFKYCDAMESFPNKFFKRPRFRHSRGTLTPLLFACIFIFSACQVKVPDVKAHSVPGSIQAGMNWSYTGHDETGEISMAETISFLEGGAICFSSEDYMRQKTAVERACTKLGPLCTFEMKQAIHEVSQRVSLLSRKR